MELSEAKEIVKDFNEKNRFRDCGKLNNAIDTVLKALDNSISKDKVRNLDVIDISGFECVALDDIKELLGEE